MGVNYTNAKLSVQDKKRDVLELISIIKTFCFNFPPTNVNFSLPSFKNDFDVISYLMDLLGTILGRKSQEIEREITRWLIERIQPLEKEIRFNLKSTIKACYACKINPRIAPWLFITDPTDPTGNTPGKGINIPIKDFDFSCLLKINPSSDVGRTVYGGPSDMNQFFYTVIQANGTPVDYFDPITNKHIATFTYIQQNAPTSGSPGSEQTGDYKNNSINMKISNTYDDPNKNIIDFINDYLNSFILFNTPKVINQSMDLIYGVLTRKIKMDTFCTERTVEFDQLTETAINCGVDDPNVEFNDSFFEFSKDDIVNIKNKTKDKQLGIKVYNDCIGCNGSPASINFETILQINNDLENTTDKAKKIEIIEKGLKDLSKTSSSSVSSDTDKNQSQYTFLEEFLRTLRIIITRLTLSPKVVYLAISMWYLVEGQASYRGIKDWFKNLFCIIREIIRKVLEDLTKFLLILVLRGLKLLIKKFIKIKIEEKIKDKKNLEKSFLPNLQSCGAFGDVLTNPAGLAYSVVDAGFDQIENATVKKNNNENSG